MKTSIVIGANHGDEGKGLITDFLSTPNSLVVRFNGGAQAAHTVVTPDGRRHVFRHHGSGTFHGAPTFLSRYFVCNPIIFAEEHEKLSMFGLHYKVHIDPDAFITTPYEMLLNQAFERTRGEGRHGSCGLGVFETIRKEVPFRYIEVLESGAQVQRRLRNHQEDAIARAKEAGLPVQRAMFDERIFLKFLDDLDLFTARTSLADWRPLARTQEEIVFEGAQGLRLHQNSKDFPHVTPSNTGSENALGLAEEANLQDIEVYYVTRTYESRHGAGPLPYPCARPYRYVQDDTNPENEHQGAIRYGYLDANRLRADILADMEPHAGRGLRGRIALTCTDQLDGPMMKFYSRGHLHQASPQTFLRDTSAALGFREALVSRGRSRDKVRRSNLAEELTT